MLFRKGIHKLHMWVYGAPIGPFSDRNCYFKIVLHIDNRQGWAQYTYTYIHWVQFENKIYSELAWPFWTRACSFTNAICKKETNGWYLFGHWEIVFVLHIDYMSNHIKFVIMTLQSDNTHKTNDVFIFIINFLLAVRSNQRSEQKWAHRPSIVFTSPPLSRKQWNWSSLNFYTAQTNKRLKIYMK